MRTFYLICLAGGLGLLGGNGFFGREFFGDRKRMELPPSVRQTPGGYRTFLHNHGFRGGK
ncbi:hypothetical protein [Holophaga foetida]|uniref:hypothetical protein n=1 Tax=Holophaga foetida TaxID=35839 RepID=UPI000247336B|nr:hypothetical protein [Holophaga foetida]